MSPSRVGLGDGSQGVLPPESQPAPTPWQRAEPWLYQSTVHQEQDAAPVFSHTTELRLLRQTGFP